MLLTAPADRTQRIQLLNDAKQTYERIINQYAQRPELVAAARMSLAAVIETLCVDGQATVEQVRNLYQQVGNDGPTTPFQPTAANLLGSLDERLARLEIVPTPPPATAPATAPAMTLRPAPAATAPALTVAPPSAAPAIPIPALPASTAPSN